MQRICWWVMLLMLLVLAACIRTRPEVIIVTQTGLPQTVEAPLEITATPLPVVPTLSVENLIQPTPDPTREGVGAAPLEHVVQSGETLSGIAAAYGVSLQVLLSVNDLPNPNQIEVGQIIRLPEPPDEASLAFKILPDSRLVRGPGSALFDVTAFVNAQPGYIRIATDEVNGDILDAVQIVQRVSLEFSVDARLLLALLEHRARWLSELDVSDEARLRPLGAEPSPLGFDRDGLYRQLSWAADQLNMGYYGWKYRGLETVEFENGQRLRFAEGLNAGTIGLQYMLSLYQDDAAWQREIGQQGIYSTYVAYFGDPFVDDSDWLVPAGVQQPVLGLPFDESEVWFYSGGPHGGWGSGSAWAAVDFAPPDDLTEVDSSCYVSEFWARAVAPGVIARTDEGTVVLDLDGDGDESTGWSILYLHLASEGRIEAGATVSAGDELGRPSCEGGFSNGTHLHLARRYNGEWIPADCSACLPEQKKPPFILNEWVVFGLPGQEYQGVMLRGEDRRIAEQGRLTTENLISW